MSTRARPGQRGVSARTRQSGYSPVIERTLLTGPGGGGPGTGGVVTDLLPWELAPDMMVASQDSIQPKGVLAQRGIGGAGVGQSNPFGDSVQLESIMAVQWGLGSTAIDLLVTNANGKIGRATAGSAGTAQLPPGLPTALRLARCMYQGDAIVCCQDGISPILRHANVIGTLTAAGTISCPAGGRVLTGSGTTFTTQAPAGSYIGLTVADTQHINYIMKVAKVTSNTELSLTDDCPIIFSAQTWASAGCGYIGMRQLVHDVGALSFSVGGPGVLGVGTSWITPIPEQELVYPGIDFVSIDGTNVWVDGRSSIVSVGTDTNMVVREPAAVAVGNVPYRISRYMSGRDACVHQASLFIVGARFARRRLYMLPPGYRISTTPNNQVDPTIIGQRDDFIFAKWADVPGPSTEGTLLACLSGGEPGPVLVFDSKDAYGVWTTYPPSPSNTTIRRIGEGAGCVDIRSAQGTTWGPVWCSRRGVHSYRDGKVIDFTAGRRSKEWQVLMQAKSANATVATLVVNDHLSVCINDPGGVGNITWVYDLKRQVWCGNHTTTAFRFAQSARPSGQPEEAYVVQYNVLQPATMGATYLDDGAPRGGTFQADLPASALGDLTALVRPIALKVAWEADGGAGVSVDVICGDGNAGSDGKADNLPGDASGLLQEKLIRPVTNPAIPPPDGTRYGTLGRQVRTFQIKLRQTGAGTPTKLRIHEISVFTRQFRTRA